MREGANIRSRIVRMSSWRGKTTISGEWRSSDFEKDTVVEFLEDIMGIMLGIVDVDV